MDAKDQALLDTFATIVLPKAVEWASAEVRSDSDHFADRVALHAYSIAHAMMRERLLDRPRRTT